MKTFKIFCLLFILSAVTLFGFQSLALASTSGELDEQYIYNMKSLYGKDFEPPFLVGQDNTGVDTDSGSLSQSENLLTLPGKNGLDFSFNVDYRSTRNNFLPLPGAPASALTIHYYYTYHYTTEGGNEGTRLVLCYEEAQAADVIYSSYYDLSLHDVTSPTGKKYFVRYKNYYNPSVSPVPMYLDRDIPPIMDDYNEYSGSHDYYQTSATYGWVARTPHFEGTTESYLGSTTDIVKGVFNDEKGALHQFTLTLDHPTLNDNPDVVDFDKYNIVDLYIKDSQGKQYTVLEKSPDLIDDGTDLGIIQHPKGFKYNVKFRSEEGRSYYFTTKDYAVIMDIAAIEDKYGNMIIYKPTDGGGIIDSYGRRINIAESSIGATISLVENGVAKELVRYNQSRVNNNVTDPTDIFKTDDEYVMTITRRENESQNIEDSSNVTRYVAKMYEWWADSLANYAFKMDRIEYPTGAQRKYEFISVPDFGQYDQVLRVSKTYSLDSASSTERKNETSYSYTKVLNGGGDTVVYQYPNYANNPYTTSVTKTGGGTDTYTYDQYERMKSTVNYISGETVNYIYDTELPASGDNASSIAKKPVIRKDSSLSGETEYYYSKGRLINEWGPSAPGTAYIYDSQYYLPTTITVDRDAHNKVVTENTLSADHKQIEHSTVKENGVVKSVTYYQYDEYGNVTQEVVTDGTQTLSTKGCQYIYNTDGSYQVKSWVEDVEDADGNITPKIEMVQDYDKRGRLILAKDAKENTTAYTYDTLGRLTTETNNSDSTSKSYAYDIVNNIITVTNENGSQEKHSYTPLGLYKDIQLRKDNVWLKVYEYQYDDLSRRTGETDYRDYNSSGVNTEKYSAVYVLDSKGRKTNQQITDIGGNVVSEADYAYTQTDSTYTDMLSMTWNANSVGTITKNSTAVLAGTTSGSQQTEVCYDLGKNYAFFNVRIKGSTTDIPVSVYGDGNLLYSTNTESSWFQHNITLHVSGVSELKLVSQNKQVQWTNPKLYTAPKKTDKVTITPKGEAGQAMPVIERYVDTAGKVYQENVSSSAGNLSTQNTYDRSGNVVKSVTGDRTSEAEYNYQNQPVKQINPSGKFTQSVYDVLGRVTSQSDYMGSVTSIQYDQMGRQIMLTAPFEGSINAVTKKYYDNNGNVIKTLTQDNAVGEAEHFKKEEFSYDARNRMIAAISYEDDSTPKYIQYKYDAVGNPTAMYTGLSAPLNTQTEQGTDMDFAVTRYEYNELNQIWRSTDALGQQSVYAYNLAGNAISMIDRLGNTTTSSYNLWGKPVTQQVTKDGATESIINTYAKGGLLKQTADSSGTTVYEYDALLRLTKETKGSTINTYQYDVYGNRTSYIMKQNGVDTLSNSYQYDTLDRLGTLTSEFGTTVYTYNDNGNLTAEQTGSFATSYAYNLAGLLTSKQDIGGSNTILSNGYVYKLDGNIKSKTDIIDGVTNYSYDGMGRLKTEQVPATELLRSYQYDDYGNRWRMAVHEEGIDRITDYTYDKNNRLTKEQTTSGGTQANAFYNYDANGNQLSKVTNSISGTPGTLAVSLDTPQNENVLNSYDGFNRLKQTEVSKDGEKTVASYTYNAAGIRTSKTVDGVTTQHILDGVNVAADVTGGLTTKYIRGMSLISMTKSNGDKIKYITDGHGDVRALAGQAGSVLKRYSYDAFGNESSVDGDDVNPFRYCGEYQDLSSGLIYLRARYYDPGVGRFISEDPIRSGSNWYVYCDSNPVSRWDPTGRAWTDEDQAEYDRLMAGSKADQKKAKQFKKDIDAATNDWNDAGGDIYKENDARYAAVVARQGVYANGYEDNFDYTRGQGEMVFLGVHSVGGVANHSCVIIMVDSSSEYYNDGRFVTSAWGGKVKFATIGAGEVDGNLVSGLNRDRDKNLSIKKDMINLNVSDKATIDNLFAYEEYYSTHNTVPYTLLPVESTSHNSNSFAHGLLSAVGISVTKPNRNLPGWDQPLEAWRFRP